MAVAIGFTLEELQGKRMWTREEMLKLRAGLKAGLSKAEAVDRVINPPPLEPLPPSAP